MREEHKGSGVTLLLFLSRGGLQEGSDTTISWTLSRGVTIWSYLSLFLPFILTVSGDQKDEGLSRIERLKNHTRRGWCLFAAHCTDVFSEASKGTMRTNGFKGRERQFWLNVRKNLWPFRQRSRQPQQVAASPSLLEPSRWRLDGPQLEMFISCGFLHWKEME